MRHGFFNFDVQDHFTSTVCRGNKDEKRTFAALLNVIFRHTYVKQNKAHSCTVNTLLVLVRATVKHALSKINQAKQLQYVPFQENAPSKKRLLIIFEVFKRGYPEGLSFTVENSVGGNPAYRIKKISLVGNAGVSGCSL